MNIVVYTLSQRLALLTTEIVGFKLLKVLYPKDDDFNEALGQCLNGGVEEDLLVVDGYLFSVNQLRIPRTSLREKLMRDLYCGGLRGHLGCDKILLRIKVLTSHSSLDLFHFGQRVLIYI